MKKALLLATNLFLKRLKAKDLPTYLHSTNVAYYSKLIAQEMGFSDEQTYLIYIGSLVHDVGKIGISNHILNKPSRLTNEEYDEIKKHPLMGYDLLKQNPLFKTSEILNIILFHHERYDGKGYPSGIKESAIPLVSRIVSVADSFDAMTTQRLYRKSKDWESAINELIVHKGSQFDPVIVDVFLDVEKRIDRISDLIFDF